MSHSPILPIEIGLTAAIVSFHDDAPHILVAAGQGEGPRAGLPSGPFDPLKHRTFEIGLRAWVEAQTGLRLGYVEQLYTFGDRGRHAMPGETHAHVVSVGYLALTRWDSSASRPDVAGAAFEPWYRYFPWEDWRDGAPPILQSKILPALEIWAKRAGTVTQPARASRAESASRRERVRLCFGLGETPWNEELVLDRYELLYSAGLVEEAARDGRESALPADERPDLGEAMRFDHRRILATAMSRLRAKLKYRPVVFELMPEEFTLTDLQQSVEAISGRHLHKQNFRRLVESSELVESTGEMSTATGGRPAALFRFRREVLQERPPSGLGVRGRR